MRSIGSVLSSGAFWAALVSQMPAAPALACPVCFSAKNEANQIAYLATTGLLTFLPLLLIGGLVLWVRRRAATVSDPDHSAGMVSQQEPRPGHE